MMLRPVPTCSHKISLMGNTLLCGLFLLLAMAVGCSKEKGGESAAGGETDPDEPALADGMKRFYLRINALEQMDEAYALDWSGRTVLINGKEYVPQYNPSRKAWYADAEESSFQVYSAELTGEGSSRWYPGGPTAPVSIPSVQFLHKQSDLTDLPLMAEYNPDLGGFLDFRPPYAILDFELSGMQNILSLRLTAASPLCGTATWSRTTRSWSFEGQGNAGKYGGRAGNLIVVIDEENNTVFSRDASELTYNKTIDLFTAMLGGTITVPTMTNDVKIKLDAGIQPGKTLEGYYIWDLKDTKTPVTIVIDKFLDMSDRYPNTEFEIDLTKIETKK